MALQDLYGGGYHGFWPVILNGFYDPNGPLSTSFTFDSTTDHLASIFAWPVSGSVTDIAFTVGTVGGSGSPSTFTMKAQLVTLDETDGYPNWGTLTDANAYGTVTVTPTTDNNSIKAVTLASAQTVTRGNMACIELVPTQVPATSPSCQSRHWGPALGLPYIATWTNETTEAKVQDTPMFAVKIGSNWYSVTPSVPIIKNSTTVYTLSAADAEGGQTIVVPFKARAHGIVAGAYVPSPDLTYKGVLYEASSPPTPGSAVATTATVDGRALVTGASGRLIYLPFTSSYTLTPGTTYYATIYVVARSAGSFQIAGLYSDTTYDSSYPWGVGTGKWGGVSRSGGSGDMTVSSTAWAAVGLILDQLDDGVGGGSGGGMRLAGHGGLAA